MGTVVPYLCYNGQLMFTVVHLFVIKTYVWCTSLFCKIHRLDSIVCNSLNKDPLYLIYALLYIWEIIIFCT